MTRPASTVISRRQLFRGDLRGQRTALRPPWAAPEVAFVAGCERCDDCVDACAEGVIRLGDGGFPEVDFAAGGCTLCGDCVRACRGRALTGVLGRDRPWDLVASIGAGCLAERGVVCRSCGEACDEDAIRFRLRVGGVAQPVLDTRACIGCGFCVGVCPVQAVKVTGAKVADAGRAGQGGSEI